jgi:hypothetical protein
MSAVVNQSNLNSSLISTLLSSDSVNNPNIYSMETIVPPYANTSSKCIGQGNFGTNGQSLYQLNKYGLITQILLSYNKTRNATGGSTIPVGDIFNCIDKVELLSSSRVLCILTNHDIMSQISDLDSANSAAVYRNAINARSAGVASQSETYVIPLCFGFMEKVSRQLDSSFLEPLSVRITLGDISKGGTSANLNTVLDNMFLNVKYKVYSEQDNAKMIAINYRDPSLNIISTRHYDENPTSVALGATTSHTFEMDIRNTDVVESFFVMVLDAENIPVQLQSVVFKGSGQIIYEASSPEELEYSKLSHNGWSVNLPNITLTTSSGLGYISKIQTGLHGDESLSNCLSLREINAPTISVKFTSTTAQTYKCVIVEKAVSLFSISSATGRTTLALSN